MPGKDRKVKLIDAAVIESMVITVVCLADPAPSSSAAR
jgi:hypothetical protein